MAICPYCGYSTGIFRKVHHACKLKYELGMTSMKDYGQQLEQTSKKTFQWIMNGAIISIAISFVVLGIANVTIDKISFGWQVSKYIFAVILIGSTTIWCLMDSEVHDYPFGKYMLFLFVTILPIALAIYLYRARGFKKGSIALTKAAGLFVSFLLLYGGSTVLTSRILEVRSH